MFFKRKKLICSKLKNIIQGNLLNEINGEECCLLDIPNHRNSGDHLIWQGEVDFLSEQIYYSCSFLFFNPKKIKKGTTILLHGGGNFGDIYRAHQEFRNKIISTFPNNKIIVLPQTVFYQTNTFLKTDANIFGKHKNLTICTRDEKSQKFLQENFHNNKVILLPDMAFCSTYSVNKEIKPSRNILFIQRTDKELLNKDNQLNHVITNIDTLDWPLFDFENNTIGKFALNKLKSLNNKISRILSNSILSFLVNPNYGIITLEKREDHTKNAVDFLSKYNLVITTRLHGFILCTLLNIPVIIIDNSYGKNSNFYNTWMSNSEKIDFAQDVSAVESILKKKYSHLCDFTL